MLTGQHRVTGLVTSTDGETLPGVSVSVLDSSVGTLTDTDGRYTLEISDPSATLQYSYVGFATQSVQVDGQSVLDIVLSTGVNLDEVVVTALGLKRNTKNLGYSIQKLPGSDLQRVQATNFVDNLSGKLAGVTVSTGATGVGSTSKITIRGEASFTSNNPLFVVDGIPINNATVVNVTNEAAAGFQEIDFGNGAMDVNPNDVKSVTVLKGPSAAALYGTRANNGVIIIETKDGSESDGIQVEFTTTQSIETPFQLPEFQNRYGQGNNGEFAFVDGLGGGINDNITYSWGPELDQGILIPQFDSPVTLPDGSVVRGGDVAVHGGLPITPTEFVSNPDNLKDFYQTGYTSINSLAVSNSGDRGYYRLSLSNLGSESYIPGVNFNRRSLGARMGFDLTEKVSLSASTNYIVSSSDNRPSNGYGSENINYSLVAWLGRQSNLNSLKDYWQPGLEGLQQYSFNYTFFDNPYFILLENQNAFDRNRLFGNLRLNYEVIEGLNISLRSGLDNSDELRTMRRAFSTNRFKNGAYAENTVNFREINTDILARYTRSISDLNLDLSVGGNRMDQIAGTQQSQVTALAQQGIYNLSNGAVPIQVFEQRAQKRINSVYGILKLGYKDYLSVDLTGRNDWSSALASEFGTDNVSFFYPSVSTSLILSNLISLPSLISFAKVRGSFAAVGNDTDAYRTSSTFISATAVNGQPAFTDASTLPNTALLPERTTAVEFGADIRVLDDRLRLDVTYYDATSENQIIALPIASSSGYDQRVINGGKVQNRGVEAIIGVTAVSNNQWKWNSTVNFSTQKATVLDLPDEAQTLTLAYTRVYDNPNQTVWYQVTEGDQIGDMWGTGYLKNENGDFVIGDDGKYIVDNNLIKLGNYNPDFILGWANEISYRGFDLNFVIDWRQGGTLVSRTQALAGVGGQLLETQDRPAEGIIAQGVNAAGEPNTIAIPAETYYRQFYDRNHEENNTYDASYIKLREASLTFQLSTLAGNTVLSKYLRQSSLSLVGRNLFALSDIPHFDPEQLAVQGQQFVSGVEDMSYPTARSIGLSLNVKF